MLIIAGSLILDPSHRAAFLAANTDVVSQARPPKPERRRKAAALYASGKSLAAVAEIFVVAPHMVRFGLVEDWRSDPSSSRITHKGYKSQSPSPDCYCRSLR
jgi:hypothetical protein